MPNDAKEAVSQGAAQFLGKPIKKSLRFPPNLSIDTSEFGDGTTNILGFTIHEFVSGADLGYRAELTGKFTDVKHKIGDPIYFIYLTTPSGQRVNYSNSWSSKELSGLSTAINMSQQIAKNVQGTQGSLLDKLKNGSQSAADALSAYGADILTTAVKEKSGNFYSDLSYAAGAGVQPYEEVLFEKTGLRGFQFGFRLIPRNPSEVQLIYDIIQLFKWASHPSLSVKIPFKDEAISTLGTRLLAYPNIFKIRYLMGKDVSESATGNDNTWLHKHGPCVCESVNVEYSPGARNYVSYRSAKDYRFSSSGDTLDEQVEGAPIYYDLQLSFKEIIYLSKEAINQGY